jgi:hypothetical protein
MKKKLNDLMGDRIRDLQDCIMPANSVQEQSWMCKGLLQAAWMEQASW